MDTIVLKFGGSSLADNEKLKTVANKIIEFHKRANKIVVVVSAQGKTTDKLIKEAYELSNIPDERELDVLLSSGEQMSMSKLAILLKQLGCDAISLTGWQAGIYTDSKSQESKILNIDTTRINQELEKNKIVIIAGFQGINENKDISTLGRGGSDTTAVAIAAAIKASHCYIFSDVDGVYSADPNKIPETKKIPELSYLEMVNLSDEGAKVLHNRCVEKADMSKWAVIACDQYTSEPEYWEDVTKIVGNNPSTLRVTLPEIYLEESNVTERIEEVNREMKKLLDNDFFKTLKDSLIYVERTQADGRIRKGLIGKVDLEDYSFAKDSQTLIRATEGTVLERRCRYAAGNK